jgi:molybdate transport system permease protein
MPGSDIWPILNAEEWQTVGLSLRVALTSVVVSLPLGLTAAWWLERREFPGKVAVQTLINLPLVLPPVVTGFMLLLLWGRRGLMGAWMEDALGLRLIFDWKGAAVAAAVMSFPLMVRAMRSGLAGVDPELEATARTLGASAAYTFLQVTLPLARRGIVAGAVLAFARSLGEFGATLMIAGSIPGETRTIPLHIHEHLDSPGGWPRAVPLVMVSVVLACAATWLGESAFRPTHAQPQPPAETPDPHTHRLP